MQLLQASRVHSAVDVRFLPCVTTGDTLMGLPAIAHPDLEFMAHLLFPSCGLFAPGDVPKTRALAFCSSSAWWQVTYRFSRAAWIGEVARALRCARVEVGLQARTSSHEPVEQLLNASAARSLVASPLGEAASWLSLYARDRGLRDGSVYNESARSYDARHGLDLNCDRWISAVKHRSRCSARRDDQLVEWSSPELEPDLSSSSSTVESSRCSEDQPSGITGDMVVMFWRAGAEGAKATAAKAWVRALSRPAVDVVNDAIGWLEVARGIQLQLTGLVGFLVSRMALDGGPSVGVSSRPSLRWASFLMPSTVWLL
jgi:hypothetical protein